MVERYFYRKTNNDYLTLYFETQYTLFCIKKKKCIKNNIKFSRKKENS